MKFGDTVNWIKLLHLDNSVKMRLVIKIAPTQNKHDPNY